MLNPEIDLNTVDWNAMPDQAFLQRMAQLRQVKREPLSQCMPHEAFLQKFLG